jgi:hypothetical protein
VYLKKKKKKKIVSLPVFTHLHYVVNYFLWMRRNPIDLLV